MTSTYSPGPYIAVVGNPNCGKTTLFNELTGMRQRVGNYAGVTVERKEGVVAYRDGFELTLLDLPGTYTLAGRSPDERIVADVVLRRRTDTRTPEAVLCVIDASNLERSLYLVTQIIDQGYPMVIALNMVDDAARRGIRIDPGELSVRLGVPVVATVASKKQGIDALKEALRERRTVSPRRYPWELPGELPVVIQEEHEELAGLLMRHDHLERPVALHEAASLLSTPGPLAEFAHRIAAPVLDHVRNDHARLAALGVDRHSVFLASRHRWVRRLSRGVATVDSKQPGFADTIDAVLTHRVWGMLVFLGLMALMFQAIFTWAAIPMEMIGGVFDVLAKRVGAVIPPGDLHDLLVLGVFGGVGSVVTFLPQILLLYLFLGLLEDTGYMARAAFVMDRVMRKAGLHGKAFIPLLSSFACAIPGIMATRTIERPRDRLVTILVAPLMSCSARLPVYSLLIGAFIPPALVLGFWNLQGLVMVALYLLGMIAALAVARILKRTILKGSTPEFIIELPPYRVPSWKNIVMQMRERAVVFLKNAGTIILAASIMLWFLASYPKVKEGTASDQLAQSFLGRAGKFIEPAIAPLGFDWKIGVGIVSSLLQREVFVSAMSTIYNVEHADDATASFRSQMESRIDPASGKPAFTILTALCVMVYYVLAMQCFSTLAVVRRETNGWKWPAFQLAYMSLLAYVVTFATYRIGLWLS